MRCLACTSKQIPWTIHPTTLVKFPAETHDLQCVSFFSYYPGAFDY